MSGEDIITAAEIRYKPLLEDFFIKKWGSTILYSHDIDHHRRVWKYARELLLITVPDDLPPEKLLMASYLHDLGMATDRSERHGPAGMELCKAFLAGNNMDIAIYSDVMEAIENHDDKEYKNLASDKSSLLKILSAADDLDAFGFIGVYRYIEIYLARGITPIMISSEIARNAASRFANFETCFGDYPSLVEKHKPRYLILNGLMTHNAIESAKDFINHDTGNTAGSLIQLVADMVRYKVPPSEIVTLAARYPGNMIVSDFIEGILKELSEI